MTREQLERSSKERKCKKKLKNEQNDWVRDESRAERENPSENSKSKKDREGREDEAERREMKDQTIEEQNKCSRQQGDLELGDKVTR